MRDLLDTIIHIPGMSALRYSLYCQSWRYPGQPSATSEQQIVYWLSLVQHDGHLPQPKPNPFAIRQRHLRDVIDHFCEIEYSTSQVSSTGEPSSSLDCTIIQKVTQLLCQDVRPFLRSSNLRQFQDIDSYDLRDNWLKLVMESKTFQKDMQQFPRYDGNGSTPVYQCPRPWSDVFGTVTSKLPLDASLALWPKLNAVQCCRLFSIFSFGPTAGNVRLAINANLPNSRAHFLYQTATLAFERAIEDLDIITGQESEFAVYSAYISVLSEAGFRNEDRIFLVACQRVTRLILQIHGPNHALSFITSQPFQEAVHRHNSTRMIEITIQMAAEAFPSRYEPRERDAFVARLWLHLKDLIWRAASDWHKSCFEASLAHIWSSHVHSRYEQLLSQLAPLVAGDNTITDSSSWQVVHYLSKQLHRYGFKLGNPVRHGIVVSALTRSLGKSHVPAWSRINYVLKLLQRSGLGDDSMDQIDQMLIGWRSEIQNSKIAIEASKRMAQNVEPYIPHHPFVSQAQALDNSRMVQNDRKTALQQDMIEPADEPEAAVVQISGHITDLKAQPSFDKHGVRVVTFQSRTGSSVIKKPKPTKFSRIARFNLAAIRSS